MIRLIGLFLLLTTALAGWSWIAYQKAGDRPLAIDKPVSFEIEKGASLRTITRLLARKGILSEPFWFKTMVVVSGNADKLKAGEYELTPGATPRGLLADLVAGKVRTHSITLVEGWTFRQMLDALSQRNNILAVLTGKSDEKIMTLIGANGRHPEGLFFPDTYFYAKGTSDLDLLRRAYRRMQTVLSEQWRNRADGLPLRNPYEALILASIIEKETGRESERAQIAGVFARRLVRGMPLQTDPTVIYGLGAQFDGNLRHRDLRRATPYNTYIHSGLPPTPIALPGAASIHAALHPHDGDSLYFVARGDGTHAFSTTVHEHNRAVDRYQKKHRAR